MEAIGNENIKWRGQTTPSYDEHLKLASETGCLELSVGVETVDNNVMKMINKNGKMTKLLKLLSKMQKNMIK